VDFKIRGLSFNIFKVFNCEQGGVVLKVPKKYFNKKFVWHQIEFVRITNS